MNDLERQRLRQSHRHLDEEIEKMMRRPDTDPLRIKHLKKQKLAIKDRLHRQVPLEHRVEQANAA